MALREAARAWTESRLTGLTAVRDTLLPVGNYADSWEQFRKNLADYQNSLLANPERLKLVERASDILTCKHEGKLGIILGTAAMFGAMSGYLYPLVIALLFYLVVMRGGSTSWWCGPRWAPAGATSRRSSGRSTRWRRCRFTSCAG